MLDADTLVIGSGAGGLTAALALARAGEKVLVLEQHYLPGGWCHSFSLEGFRFSPGVHYLGEMQPGGMMRRIYEGLGVARHLTMFEMAPDGFDRIWAGGRRFAIPKGADRLAARLGDEVPGDAAGIADFIALERDLARELETLTNATSPARAARAVARSPKLLRYGLRRLGPVLDDMVSDPFARFVLSVQGGDYGVPPDKASLPLHAAIVAHYFGGAWYPKGGGASLPKAYIKELKRHGSGIRVRSEVQRILVEKKGGRRRAVGVRLADGETLRARRVISNADPAMTYGRLLAPEFLPRRYRRRLDKQKWSIATICAFLGVDMDLRAAGLDSGNLWIAREPSVASMYDASGAVGGGPLPGVFLTAPSLKDPTKRKDGRHTLEAFTFFPWEPFEKWAGTEVGERPPEYEAFKESLGDRIVDLLEDTVLPGLRDHVAFRAIGTPLTNDFYAAAHRGNIYGTDKTLGNIGPLAWPVKTPIDNLLHCGASTVAHGVAGASVSGLVAAGVALGRHPFSLLDRDGEPLTCYDAESWQADRKEAVA